MPVIEPSYNARLIIASDGTTQERNDVRAAGQAAGGLTRGYSRLRMRPPLVRVPVRYGGSPGVMILNLPGQPSLVVVIVLAHHGALYRIVAPGATLGRDQRQALGSLRFIWRLGPFPSANPPAPRARPSHRTIPSGTRFPMVGEPPVASSWPRVTFSIPTGNVVFSGAVLDDRHVVYGVATPRFHHPVYVRCCQKPFSNLHVQMNKPCSASKGVCPTDFTLISLGSG